MVSKDINHMLYVFITDVIITFTSLLIIDFAFNIRRVNYLGLI
jgi:hypothetical protein